MPSDQVKVLLEDESGNRETLWADALGGNLYRLDNRPWYAYGVSRGDVVEARPESPGDFPKFVRVVQKSGNRTLRLVLAKGADADPSAHAILDQLRSLGCSYEGANPRFFAVEVPPHVNLDSVSQFLISTGEQWEYADPTYEHLFPGPSEPAG
jgi:hypothetical protein